MSLSDIFTPSVVISLAISVLLIGLFGLYVNNKLNEQNHKLNTMFDLVSTLANELQMVRSQPLGAPSMGGGGERVYERPEVANTNHLVNMIDVSDNSDSSGDESDGDTDEGAESGSDDDDNNEDQGDGDDSGSDGDDEESDGDSDDDGNEENDARSDKAIVVSESLDDALFEELANLDEIVFEETDVERVKTPETTTTTHPSSTQKNTNTNNVKNLNVVFDYKKASLSKLREIVEQKGLSSDTSKLKKQELLKMLEID